MAALPDDMENCPSSTVSITVLTVKPVKFGKIFAQAIRVLPMGTRIDLPMFRDESGVWRRAITLPDEICGPIGKAVLDALVERGLAVRGPAM
jgi:hypothetical protein